MILHRHSKTRRTGHIYRQQLDQQCISMDSTQHHVTDVQDIIVTDDVFPTAKRDVTATLQRESISPNSLTRIND